MILVTGIVAAQFFLCTLAAFAFARFEFRGSGLMFALVLMQLLIMPDILIVENYRTMSQLGLIDTITAIGLPYVASAFGIFLLRQTFMTVPCRSFLRCWSAQSEPWSLTLSRRRKSGPAPDSAG